jgi:PAS domain S-box-containing protein
LRELRDEARALFSAHSQDEAKLKELTRYLEIFESSRDAMLVMDESGKVLFANPMAAQLSHQPLHVLVGASLVDLVAEKDGPAVREVLFGFSHGQYPAGLDLGMRPGCDSSRALTTVSVNFSAMPGNNRAVLATLRDVTAERGMARELSRTKEFLERVIESSVDGIVSADLRGNVLVFNRSACRLFGYERAEVIGKMRVDRLYPPGVAKDIMRRIKSAEGGGVGRLTEERVEMLTQKGERVPVNLSASLVMNGDRPVGTVGIFTDIRNRLAMEARLAEAQQQLQDRQRQDAIAEIAGAAAHELNQPLTSVMGYAEYLKRGVSGDPALAHAVEVIMGETQRMAEIVRKVGKITRYETKPYVGATKIVDLDRSSTPER